MSKQPLYYTFGNHMHWVDMEWLWGYHVLPGSVRDMLHYCRETGAKGNVNFDGIGYEKLAAESPEALAELREAVQAGTIEPVGCSYGQPYGLFHGGESNVRQRVYGARAVRRLLGVWPQTFWEEEFDFFPQLPQILKGCGFKYASLFFQWTWHTPEIPKEEAPAVWWEAPDGSRLLAATRNALNLHQWPEDVDTMLADLDRMEPGETTPLIQQWLELMPSKDWMCRSEVLLPRMKALLADERFEIQCVTLGEYLSKCGTASPVRRYSMDDVWHGMTLGKNGDRIRRYSRVAEQRLQSSEAAFATLSLLGRPYAQWDVYPTWELEEAWRKLLRSQHHDNDECEGLCGHVAYADYEWLESSYNTLIDRFETACQKFGGESGRFNPNGWEVDGVPAFGFGRLAREADLPDWTVTGSQASLIHGNLSAQVDLREATLKLVSPEFPDGVFAAPMSLIPVEGEFVEVSGVEVEVREHRLVAKAFVNGQSFLATVEALPDAQGVGIYTSQKSNPDCAGGYRGGSRLAFVPNLEQPEIRVETPYGVAQVEGRMKGVRKYPEGDWMTSPQWFEDVEGGFYGLSFVDFSSAGRGLLVRQDSTTQWFRRDSSFEYMAATYDPWDEKVVPFQMDKEIQLIPHGSMSATDCWKLANVKPLTAAEGTPGDFSTLSCSTPNVALTAFYRETDDYSGMHLENYAGVGMGYPFVVRLVEFDGLDTLAEIHVAGEVAKAYKTNLLGQVETELEVIVETGEAGHPHTDRSSLLRVPMRGNEIATLYLDIVEGRKVARDLDAKREVWAQVHRHEEAT